MSDTTLIKDEIETWYREKIEKENPKYKTGKRSIQLTNWSKEGRFEVDVALYENDILKEVHCLSISEYKTASGKNGDGKSYKIMKDALMLMGMKCDKKVLVFTHESMYNHILQQQKIGRFPPEKEIKLKRVENIPSHIQDIIHQTQKQSSEEIKVQK